MIVIISKDQIEDLDTFESKGYVIQTIKNSGVLYFINCIEQLDKEVKDFCTGEYFLCDIDVPFDYPKEQKKSVDEFLNGMFAYIDGMSSKFSIRKIFSIFIS
jgi:hypothetical protein